MVLQLAWQESFILQFTGDFQMVLNTQLKVRLSISPVGLGHRKGTN